MNNFPLNHRKFKNLNNNLQNSHLSKWLADCYRKTITKELSTEQLKILFHQYLSFFLEQIKIKEPKTNAEWSEFFSQRFHYHRQAMKQTLKESDFLPTKANLTHPNEVIKKRADIIKWQVVLTNIRSAFNIGSVFRTVDGAGWEKVWLSGYSALPNNKNLQKAAMNSTNWVEWEKAVNLTSWLKNQTKPIIALETTENAENCFQYNWQEQGILILGNEEYGISKELLKLCTAKVAIPMLGIKKSLNVANAFAIIAYLVRQQTSYPLSLATPKNSK